MPTATFYRSATRGGKFSDHSVNLIVTFARYFIFIFPLRFLKKINSNESQKLFQVIRSLNTSILLYFENL